MITNLKKCLAFAVTALLAVSLTVGVAAKPKEKITDPKLLLIQKLSKPVKSEQFIQSKVQLVTGYRSMMSFDVDKDGAVVYYTQPGVAAKYKAGITKAHETYFIKGQGRMHEKMTTRYFGNCQQLCVEHAADGDYLWIGSNATNDKGEYRRARTLSRVKFEDKAELNDGYAGENFYIGDDGTYLQAAVNVKDDILAISTSYKGIVTFRIYSLSEAMALPETTCTVKVKCGGENIGEELTTITRTVKCRDLRDIDPQGMFVLPKTENKLKEVNSHSFHGFDADKDYIYFVEGNNNGNSLANGTSNAFVTVFKHSGEVALSRRRISVISDKFMLANLGISETACAEIEGIKIRDGKVYIGFTSRTSKEKVMRANIVCYK